VFFLAIERGMLCLHRFGGGFGIWLGRCPPRRIGLAVAAYANVYGFRCVT
jgi:hypothetical protein